MARKIMGLVAGRKNGNSDILVKEALLAASEMGAECSLLYLSDYNIKHCTGCENCTMGMGRGEDVGCVYDNVDDMKKILEAMFIQDAIIIGCPTYDLMPSTTYLTFSHRFMSYEMAFKKKVGTIDKIPDRVAGLIAVGGSTRSWQSLALECMSASMFTQSIRVVDQMMAEKVGRPGHVTLFPDTIARARKMGENIMNSLDIPQEDRGWYGDEGYGWCPVCHSNTLQLGEPQWDGLEFPVECTVCGTGGAIATDDNGKYKFIPLPGNGRLRDRTTNVGRGYHMDEIMEQRKHYFSQEETAKQRTAKYKEIKFPAL